ncbi:Plexin domain-containing protein 2 [Sparganum proliferum]
MSYRYPTLIAFIALVLLAVSCLCNHCIGGESEIIFERDSNDYYTSHIYVATEVAHAHFRFDNEAFSNDPQTHEALLGNHRVAVRIPLPFVFKFFGYPTTNVTLATGGFLYMGDLLHDHLTYSQYIAPLMADFDTSLGRDNYFIAKWENVVLKHCPNFYAFSFSVTLFKNGTIAFAYIQVSSKAVLVGKTSSSRGSDTDLRASLMTKNTSRSPVGGENERDIMEAPKAQRDVIVGVSDAYLHYPGGGKARRIVEYDSLNIPLQLVRTGVVIYLTPNPSCVEQKTCRDCLHQDLKNFVCQWCAQTLTCSSGVDRDWQRWHEMKCHLSVRCNYY